MNAFSCRYRKATFHEKDMAMKMQHTITMMLTNISTFEILTSQGEVPDNSSFDTAKPCLIPTTAGMPGFISAFKTDYKLLRLNRVDASANKVTL